MEITEVFYPRHREEWRSWLVRNHQVKPEVWLQTFNKASGQPSIKYDELVEECLCFGWIDGVVKKYTPDSTVQRITPRRKKSFLSELNRQRVWKLQREGLMTEAGLLPIESQLGSPDDSLDIPAWVLEQLSSEAEVWEQFKAFPRLYQRLKIGWIKETLQGGQRRLPEAQKRLNYLIKMTRQGKMYGTIPLLE
ncbi:MAG: YdeI/OmpD-associated family protein [Lewinellaceae bacterium]|nr:YdeI/OmpD-associated family protein [Lewinellaceae bacterium]